MNICSNCGAQMEEGQTFCTNCGQPVTNQNGAVNQSPGVYNNGTNSTQNFYASFADKPEILKIFGVVGGVIMILSLWMPFVTASNSWGMSASASLWTLYEEANVTFVAGFTLVCLMAAIGFWIAQKNILTSIMLVLSIFPVALVLVGVQQQQYNNVKLSIGCFAFFIGYVAFCMALHIQRKIKKMRKQGLIA